MSGNCTCPPDLSTRIQLKSGGQPFVAEGENTCSSELFNKINVGDVWGLFHTY